MKNIERYLTELLEYGIETAITKDGKITTCAQLQNGNDYRRCCENCLFGDKYRTEETCYEVILKWLFEEVDDVQKGGTE